MIPKGVQNLLRRILASEDEEIVYEKGAGWWIGDDRTSGRYPLMAIRLCLLSCDELRGFGGRGMERWTINEEGRKAAADASYEPLIIEALRKRNAREQGPAAAQD